MRELDPLHAWRQRESLRLAREHADRELRRRAQACVDAWVRREQVAAVPAVVFLEGGCVYPPRT